MNSPLDFMHCSDVSEHTDFCFVVRETNQIIIIINEFSQIFACHVMTSYRDATEFTRFIHLLQTKLGQFFRAHLGGDSDKTDKS